MVRLGGVFTLVAIVVWIYAFYDALTAPVEQVRNLPKAVWLLLILLLPPVGVVVWFVWGRPRAGVKARTRTPFNWQGHGPPPADPRRRSLAPDDDPEFLRRLKENLRREDDGDDPVR